jgi:hypothetical protein
MFFLKCLTKFCIFLFVIILYGCKTPQYNVLYNVKDFNIDFCNNIKFFKVGNPLGNADNNLTKVRYYNYQTRWYGTAIGSLLMGGASLFCPPLICGMPIAALLGYGTGRAMDAYYGGPFDYASYNVPTRNTDIVFYFSGADEGACGHEDYGYGCAYCSAAREYGKECVAMFNFKDIDKAIQYAEKLPDGTRLIVRGHSMGGSAALKFVHKLRKNKTVLLLDTRDPTSWFGHKKEKPSNVMYWRNILPGDTRLWSNPEIHKETNYIGKFNMANVFMFMGRPWGICYGATNIILEGKDHHEVGKDIDN